MTRRLPALSYAVVLLAVCAAGGALHAQISFDRSTLREFTVVKTSPMPSSRGVLDAQELADIVAYLTTLRGQR